MNWSGRLLCDILHDNLKHIVLGHLSKENNYAKLAYETVKLEVTLADNDYRERIWICLSPAVILFRIS